MKTNVFFSIVALAFLSASCTNAYMAGNAYDDVYYNPSRVETKPVEEVVIQSPDNSGGKRSTNTYKEAASSQDNRSFADQQRKYSEQSSNQINNDYSEDSTQLASNSAESGYNPDDYYDYEYSARIRRFHNPLPFNSYYDDYYTDLYWYTNNPYTWGTSIYTGYWGSSYWGPGYGVGIGWNWGWGSIGFGWSSPYYGWGYPYYGWNSGYYGWGYPWYGGYWNGYMDGWWDHHYHHGGGIHYDDIAWGPRANRGSSNLNGSNGRREGSLNNVNNRRAEVAGGGSATTRPINSGNNSGTGVVGGTVTGTTLNNRRAQASGDKNLTSPTNTQNPTNPTPANNDLNSRRASASSLGRVEPQSNEVEQNGSGNTAITRPVDNNDARSASSQRRYARPEGYDYSRYSRVNNASGSGSNGDDNHQRMNNSRPARDYRTPNQSRTRSSDEFVNPGNSQRTYTAPTNSDRQIQREQSSGQRRSYDVPARRSENGSNSRTYTPPSSPSQNYSAPTRSGNSGGSSPSYTPSRSSGSGSSGSSSGNSGGRRR